MSDHTEIHSTDVRSIASRDADASRRWAMRLWQEAIPIAGTVAELYLCRVRRLVLPPDISPRVLRFHPGCAFGSDARHPCLLALYCSIVGDEPCAIMRTALAPDGFKIDRLALGPVSRAAIKLPNHVGDATALTVGEHIEATLAGMAIGFAPAWALGSVSAIANFPVLAGVETLTVLGEAGDGGANERAVKECAARWNAAGRAVYRAMPRSGGDHNNALIDTSRGPRHE
jgi:putative DNA primase/helicase